jgi:hypothetical protein
LTAKGNILRHPKMISGNSNYRVAVAPIPRLQAIEIVAKEALAGLHLNPAN